MKSLHETDEQLELFALDRLPEAVVERIEEHLMICDSCRMRLEDIAQFAHSMRSALRTMQLGPVPARRGWFEGWKLRFAFAGALAFALLLSFVAYRNGSNRSLPLVATITLSALRGGAPAVPPARETELTLDGVDGQQLTVELVDAAGRSQWSGVGDAADGKLRVKVGKSLEPGTYFVRLNSSGGELLREYGFQVKR
jgi:hypothetical protein